MKNTEDRTQIATACLASLIQVNMTKEGIETLKNIGVNSDTMLDYLTELSVEFADKLIEKLTNEKL